MGIDGRRYDTQRWELMAGDTIYEMGTDGKRYVIQRLELMACDTIYRDGNRW